MSAVDVAVLVVGVFVAADVGAVTPWLGVAIAFVIGHFFLFCNVVRMGRPRELAWAGLFVALSAATETVGFPGWLISLSVSFVATIVLIALELQRPDYHGAFWQHVNPGLRQWWDANGPP